MNPGKWRNMQAQYAREAEGLGRPMPCVTCGHDIDAHIDLKAFVLKGCEAKGCACGRYLDREATAA